MTARPIGRRARSEVFDSRRGPPTKRSSRRSSVPTSPASTSDYRVLGGSSPSHRRATSSPACQPGARPPAGGNRLGVYPAARDHPGDHRVRVPHLARPEIIATPHRRRDLRDHFEHAPRPILVVVSRQGCPRLRRRPGSAPATADLVAEDPKRPAQRLPTAPSATTPRCSPLRSATGACSTTNVAQGLGLEAPSGRGRTPDAARPRRQRLVHAPVEPDEVPARAKRQPKQVHCRRISA